MRRLVRATHRHALALEQSGKGEHPLIRRAANNASAGVRRRPTIRVCHLHAGEGAPLATKRTTFLRRPPLVGAAPGSKLIEVSADNRNPGDPTEGSPTALSSADPIRNFTLTVEERIRALTIGVPAWAARKRKIEDDERRYVEELVELHDTLAVRNGATKGADAEIERSLLAAANTFDLSKLNELVRKHNRYYPVEANLPIDHRTGGYLVYGRSWTPEAPYTATRLVELARTRIARRDCARDSVESSG